MKAIISNIERLATYDGPGLRTVIYFKGCPLRCSWCSNPETQLLKPQIMVQHQKCISCMRCVEVCPKQAISYNQQIFVDFDQCDLCQKCVNSCPSGSIKVNGRDYSLEELRTLINRDKEYFTKSGGGLTVSGGEMLMHGKFVIELFKLMKQDRINTAIETSGYGEPKTFLEILKLTDTVIMDYKVPFCDYKLHTKRDADLIKTNLINAVENGDALIRIPLIPTINTSPEIVEQMIEELLEIGVKKVELLKYHRYGIAKYEALNQEYQLSADLKLSDATFEEIKTKFKQNFELI